jgi:hypothetical protein
MKNCFKWSWIVTAAVLIGFVGLGAISLVAAIFGSLLGLGLAASQPVEKFCSRLKRHVLWPQRPRQDLT